MRKLKLAEQFSDIDTSGKDDTAKKLYRRERAKKKYYTSDSEEESHTSSKLACKEIPSLPTFQIVNEQSHTTQKMPEKVQEKVPETRKIFDKKLVASSTSITDSSLYDFNKCNTKESSSGVQSDILYVGQQCASCNTGKYFIS